MTLTITILVTMIIKRAMLPKTPLLWHVAITISFTRKEPKSFNITPILWKNKKDLMKKLNCTKYVPMLYNIS